MTTLTDSLPGSPFCGCGSADDEPGSSEALELPSDDVLEVLHHERRRQSRNHLLAASLGAAGALVVAAFVAATPFGTVCLAGLAVVLLGVFGEAVLEWRRLRRTTAGESWLHDQRQDAEDFSARSEYRARVEGVRARATYAIAVVVGLVTVIQFVTGMDGSIAAAALVKPAVLAGEWWRLLTAAFLHAGLLHLVSNVSALVVFGTMIEAFDRRMRVPLAYLAGVLGGSLASTVLLTDTSVGASSGVLGLLGYVAATGIGPSSSPAWMRRRVLANLGAIALTGAIGYLFIDNAGHFGGALAGAAVGVISSRAGRRSAHWVGALDTCGWLAAAILLSGAAFTIGRLLHTW